MTNAIQAREESYDVVIVGARCAGAATAMLLARSGARVLLVDRGAPGGDTLSTHALMRGGVLALSRWGVLPDLVRAGTPPVRTASFHYGTETTDVPVRPRDGVDALYAPRRRLLDAHLVAHARAAGVTVRHGTSLVGIVRDATGRVIGATLRGHAGQTVQITRVACALLVGADGIASTVAQLVGAPTRREGSWASATIYAYFRGLPHDGYRWRYVPGASSGEIPTNDGETCVFVSVPSRRFRDSLRMDVPGAYARVLEEIAPDLATSMRAAERTSRLHGFAGRVGHLRGAWGPGWALVGDAGYFRDPITAHGMTDALRDAELLARAVLRGSDDALADYESMRDAVSIPLLEATDRIASFLWDLPMLQKLHADTSEAMKREVALLSTLPPLPTAAYGLSSLATASTP
jgi:2-polyprenyl-6-methoxyphenol hydroxylase-like FAD-dependent oxidoreductase